MAGALGVPADASAVIVNVTAVNPTVGGYLTAWPTGDARPGTSNLNPRTGRAVPNLAILPLGAGGRISLFNFAGSTHVVVDVVGYVTPYTGVGAPWAVTAQFAAGGIDVNWSPPVWPRGVTVDGYDVVGRNGTATLASSSTSAAAHSVRLTVDQTAGGLADVTVTSRKGTARAGTTRPAIAPGALGTPEMVNAEPDNGMALVAWRPVVGATGYDVIAQPVDGGTTIVTFVPASAATTGPAGVEVETQIVDARPGHRYHVRVRAVTATAQGPWSTPRLVHRIGWSLVAPSGAGFGGIALDATRDRAYLADTWGDHIRVLDLATQTWRTPLPVSSHPTSVAVSIDGARVIVGTGLGDIVVLDAETGRELLRTQFTTPWRGYELLTVRIAALADGTAILDSGRVIDLATGKIDPFLGPYALPGVPRATVERCSSGRTTRALRSPGLAPTGGHGSRPRTAAVTLRR